MTLNSDWSSLSRSEILTVNKHKPGSSAVQVSFRGAVLEASRDSLTVDSPKGNAFQLAGGEVWRAPWGAQWRFFRDQWHNVADYEGPSLQSYCNVSTPAELDGTTLSWTDLYLDLEVFSDGSWWIADIDELAAVAGSLPTSLLNSTIESVERLVECAEQGRAPFAWLRGSAESSASKHLFWSSPRTGDGIVVTHKGAEDGSQTVRRILGHFGATRQPVSTDHAESALRGLAAPQDGLLAIGRVHDMDDVVSAAGSAAETLGMATGIHVLLIPESTVDPVADARAAVGPHRKIDSLAVRLGSALGNIGERTWVAASPDFIAGGLFE